MDYAEIGKRRPRTDAGQQVTGQILYVGDMHLPGMLHAKGLLSSEHHARIVSIDTSRAESLPGVRGVATWRDLANNITGQIIQEQPIFAASKVRHRGEIVALVAADTEEIAQAGVDLIDVKYERLPAVFDAREAMQPDAPLIHEECQGKFCKGNKVMAFGHDCLRLVHGDVEKGFAESEVIVEETFSTSAQRSVPIEPHACLVRPDGAGAVTVWSNTQVPFMVSGILAPALGLPLNKVRVIATAIGGGFGQKGQMTIEAKRSCARLEDRAPGALGDVDARQHAVRVHQGAALHDLQARPQARRHLHGHSPHAHFQCRRLRIDGVPDEREGRHDRFGNLSNSESIRRGLDRLHQHVPERAAFRGFGMSQPSVAIESIIDIAAKRIGMDPMELRLRNALVDGDQCGTGQVMHSVGITACLDKVKAMSRWDRDDLAGIDAIPG